MKRSDCLGLMKAAGYHGDKATFTRLLVENRVSRMAAEEAFRLGVKAKAAGVSCGCLDCMGNSMLEASIKRRTAREVEEMCERSEAAMSERITELETIVSKLGKEWMTDVRAGMEHLSQALAVAPKGLVSLDPARAWLKQMLGRTR